ncbi:MAG: NAD(+)/NADH kinase [Aeriscardovia sp.]|nr:NAD(+)/NADH kinase [Aeriscardovia sp.]
MRQITVISRSAIIRSRAVLRFCSLLSKGFKVNLEAAEPHHPLQEPVKPLSSKNELAVALGGDGTVLAACERVKGTGIPLFGINMGHLGFLTQPGTKLSQIADEIFDGAYPLSKHFLLEASIEIGRQKVKGWALNEMAVERSLNSRMISLDISVDGARMAAFDANGLVIATPTGSTAYALSAGGAVVWPGVRALEVVPVAGAVLMPSPLIVGKESEIEVEILQDSPSPACLIFDGRRSLPAKSAPLIRVRHSSQFIAMAGSYSSFAQHLASKFRLPALGWKEGEGGGR